MNTRLSDTFIKQKWKKKLLHLSLSNYVPPAAHPVFLPPVYLLPLPFLFTL